MVFTDFSYRIKLKVVDFNRFSEKKRLRHELGAYADEIFGCFRTGFPAISGLNGRLTFSQAKFFILVFGGNVASDLSFVAFSDYEKFQDNPPPRCL